MVGEAEDVSLGSSVLVPLVSESSELCVGPSVFLFYSSGSQLLHVEVQHMFAQICMLYVCVSVIH